MAADRYDVLIVGAGHAGAQAAVALRQEGFTGTVGMIGDELDPPYERPPLSKEYFAGDKPFERIMIRPAAFWEQREIDLLLGRKVEAVDPETHNVSIADGTTIGYGQLIWATGGAPRKLSCDGHQYRGIHTVRNRPDVDRMTAELAGVERVVVIGGGYIGLEAAAVLTKFGKHVTLVEALDRVLARVAGEQLSRFYEGEHRAHGVDVRLSTAVDSIEGNDDGVVTGVRLADGEVLPAQMVIVGIGIIPAVQPLIAAGAVGGNGVDVDDQCRTSLPDIFAIGDCAAHVNAFADGIRMRVESVQNANDQATTTAKVIAGKEAAYTSVPWFWSNQYDLRLQTIGLSTGFDTVVTRGDVASRSFSVVYLRRGKVIALDCVNAVKDYVHGRALVVNGLEIAPDRLADAGTPLKELAAA